MIDLKHIFCQVLTAIQIDALFRFINRNTLLVIMYHGITCNDYDPPVWTQLPEKTFRQQLEFLRANYNILSISKVICLLDSHKRLPQRSALITFDDGLRNNYTVAFPILQQYSIPATIFLTTDFISTSKLLWFDELFFILREATVQGIMLPIMNMPNSLKEDFWQTYRSVVNMMKRKSEHERKTLMEDLRRKVTVRKVELLDDFGMLTWGQVLEMKRSGLIEFGAHTANHQILSNISENEWEKEIKVPREELSSILGHEALSFSYPNGRPEADFAAKHVTYLKNCGYRCAFTTQARLHSPSENDFFRIGRFPAGNDFTSDLAYFKLNTSGILQYLKALTINPNERV